MMKATELKTGIRYYSMQHMRYVYYTGQHIDNAMHPDTYCFEDVCGVTCYIKGDQIENNLFDHCPWR